MSHVNVKAAAEKIKAILKEHDLAAMIVLQDRKAVEYVNELSPSWSCAKLTEEGEFRLRCKRFEFASREAQEETLSETVGMVMSFWQQAERNRDSLSHVAALIAKHIDFEHFEKHL